MTALVDKYRPRTLDDLLGQPWVVEQLRAFARNPFPCAFLFEGETGCGKTSAALALAHDLGAGSDEWPELAGLYQIASGEQTGDSVRQLLRTLQLCPLRGSGWKVAVINEADYMSTSAAQIWLDALENLPPRSVIVFTTNHAGKLPRRLRDRCECYRFESSALLLRGDPQRLINRGWEMEGGLGPGPDLDELGDVADEQGNASFRRVLQRLAPRLRAGPPPAPPPAPAPRPAATANNGG